MKYERRHPHGPQIPGLDAAQEDSTPSTGTLGDTAGDAPADSSNRPVFARGEVVAERFRIEGLIGRGGGGEVFAAHDLLLDQRIALKAVGGPIPADAGFDQLRSEVLAARGVTHPNVCRTFDLLRHRAGDLTIPVMTMELLEGETLARRLRRQGAFPEDEAYEIICQLAAGLAAAHSVGILHLDLKSSNVVLVDEPSGARAVITDFGLATGPALSPPASNSRRGTPGYMAPEKARGDPPTPATDVYSLGCVLHEILTGALPVVAEGEGPIEVLPKPLGTVVTACLAPDPEGRPPHGGALLARLSAVRRSEEHRPFRSVRAAVLAALLGGVLAMLGPGAGGGVPAASRPLAAEAHRQLVRGLEALGDFEPTAALEALDGAVEAAPSAPVLRLARSEAWSELGWMDRARAEVEAAAAMHNSDRETALWLEARRLEIQGRPAEAADRYQTLYALRPQHPHHLVRSVTALLLGGRAEEADRRLAFHSRDRGSGDDSARLEVLEAMVARDLGDFNRQLAAARRAARSGQERTKPGVAAAANLLAAEALRELARAEEGLASAEAAYRSWQQLQNPRGQILALLALANLHAESGDPVRAREEFTRALALARKIGDRRSEAEVLLSLGAETLQEGDLELARSRIQRAARLTERLGHEGGLASARGNLALIHLMAGELRSAEREFERAITLRRRTGPPAASVPLLNNLASLYAQRGEPRRAREAWTECLALAIGSGQSVLAAIASLNLAHLELLEGDLEQADRRLEVEAKSLVEKVDHPVVSSEALQVAARIALFRDQEPKALDATTRSIETLLAYDAPSFRTAITYQVLAQIHNSYGRFREAETVARQSVAALEQAQLVVEAAEARLELVTALLGQGKPPEPRATLDTGNEEASEDSRLRLLTALIEGKVSLASGHAGQALEAVLTAIEETPPDFLIALRMEAELLLSEAEIALGRTDAAALRLRRLSERAVQSGFELYVRRARERLAGTPDA